MEAVSTILVLLLAVVVSGALSRMLPVGLPRPLVQIALGAIIGFAANLRVQLDPELFFLLFLPPLLFLDGWRIPKDEMLRDAGTILELALGLVVFTVLGMGFFIDWMIPAMPLPVAFALAAVVSPTDPIAVSAIAARVPIPDRLMHILEGESLLNDASGLVCLRFAIAAALTGTFSLWDASLTFLWLALGGIAVGIAVSWLIVRAGDFVSRRFGEESGSQILISLLIPFAAYLAAEHLHCSGILAAVAAGVTMSITEFSGRGQGGTRVRRSTVWDMVQFAANGVIFVLLGEQLPVILGSADEAARSAGIGNIWWLLLYAVAITVGLALLRLVWVTVSLSISLVRRQRQGIAIRRPPRRLVLAVSLAGVRGAITLAGVLTLPLTLPGGAPFPARDLTIFLATSVIILSLVAASLALPLLLKDLEMEPHTEREAEEDRARIIAAEAAIKAVEKAQHDLSAGRTDADVYVDAAARVMGFYRERLSRFSHDGEEAALARRSELVEEGLRLTAVKAERDAIFASLRRRRISSETARKLVRELDLLEARYRPGTGGH
ncbi:Na+/H+ antiporter [Mangrovicella endophytica]|uniref:Na+/H+ antiporter n=1 Tax=Mangrovicella endophytica TaxID=2066697 RepID=UPI000C9EB4EA|nr:Na+/H+ antiporter [Mangrovicella endophytica]